MTIRYLTLALAVCITPLAGCGKDPYEPEKRAPETARAVTVAKAERRPLVRMASASGLLVAREEAAVGVEQAGYRVLRVFVEEGARVSAGQPLAVLDQTVLLARLTQAREQAENAQSEAHRVRGLDGTGVVADEEIANRRSQARVAQAQLRELQTQAAQTTVRAPVSGIVLERTVRPGSVSGGEPMFRIARGNLVELDAEVPEALILTIKEGSSAQVTLADGEILQGTVRLIGPTIDPDTKLGRVRIKLPRNEALRVGGFASASFRQTQELVTVIPEKAVQFEASGPQVTVIDARNRAKRVPVKTGARMDGLVELVQGPPAGSRIALGGGAFLLDGDLVTPVSAQTAYSAPASQPAGNW